MAAKASDKVYGRQWCMWLKNMFSRSLKVANDCEVTTSAGRLFPTFIIGEERQRRRLSRRLFCQVRRTISLWNDADRSRRRGPS